MARPSSAVRSKLSLATFAQSSLSVLVVAFCVCLSASFGVHGILTTLPVINQSAVGPYRDAFWAPFRKKANAVFPSSDNGCAGDRLPNGKMLPAVIPARNATTSTTMIRGALTAKPFGRRRSLPPIWHQRVLYAATQKQRRSPRRLRVSERPSLPLAPACDDLTQFSDALVATKNALSVTTRSTMAGFVIG
jgi:hypothetical protein